MIITNQCFTEEEIKLIDAFVAEERFELPTFGL